MIIRDDSAKAGDPHKQAKATNNGEQLQFDLGRPLTEEEKKIFEKLKEGLQMG
ncbi:MAG: hypothetical protein LKI76_08580 [Megasphaera sp.]|jgi:hypothetical protein|uniref:Uncharacterized protein n=1 Tax=Megasphaera paucivorans TaxID=349095 RepID=A0A1G9WQ61_9FIRM|nr:hypothetical protein [Megasphaera paucivorans]MCI1821790.1 hypothetical protein [Megasphaera sp.]MCI1823970.1 hypothetical protein [Megasphaera sp.]SDM86569.1 hypothetical protein SAMN05660299_01669 [Megasphaera paucivorans]